MIHDRYDSYRFGVAQGALAAADEALVKAAVALSGIRDDDLVLYEQAQQVLAQVRALNTDVGKAWKS